MTLRKRLLGIATGLAFIPTLSLPAAASSVPAGQMAVTGTCKHWAAGSTGGWEKKCRPRGSSALQLYISAPYQDNGVTVVSLWWTAPAGATSFSLATNENTGAGQYGDTESGLPDFGPSNPYIVQVEGATPLYSATFQVTDNLGDTSNIVTYP